MKPLSSLFVLAFAGSLFAGPMGYDAKNPKEPVLPLPEAPPEPQCRISYDFIEAGWSHDMPNSGPDSDGAFLGFQKSFNDTFFGLGHVGRTFTGDSQTDAVLGVGAHVPLATCFDWTTKVGCLYIDDKYGSHFGYAAATGLRVSVARWLELNAFYNVGQILQDGDELDHSATATLVFKEIMLPQVDTIVSGIFSETGNGVSVGLRYNF